MSLKQIFCNHIWKFKSTERLGDYIRYAGGFIPHKTIHEYVAKYDCIKCQKEKLVVKVVEENLTTEEFIKYSKYSLD